MAKIIGPGSLNVDITGYAPHLPVAGETTKGTTLRFSAGGKGSNQMVAAHRAGAEALLIGQRGADVLGDILGKFYAAEGISECYITATRENETGSANEKVGRESVLGAEKDFADADAVLTQFETTVEAVLAAKELAQKYGKPFILNPAPHIDVDKKVFDGVDFVTPNESEAEQFTGVKVASTEDCRKAAAAFFEMGVKNVIITLGSRGAYFTDGKREVLVPCLKMKAVETTGAGDAFNGGFATAIAEGRDVETALKFATCTAAISVTRLGAATSMPERHEIEALLQKEFGIIL